MARPKVIITIAKFPAGCPATTSKTSARAPVTPPGALVTLIPQPQLRLECQLHVALREIRWANEFKELHRALCAPGGLDGWTISAGIPLASPLLSDSDLD